MWVPDASRCATRADARTGPEVPCLRSRHCRLFKLSARLADQLRSVAFCAWFIPEEKYITSSFVTCSAVNSTALRSVRCVAISWGGADRRKATSSLRRASVSLGRAIYTSCTGSWRQSESPVRAQPSSGRANPTIDPTRSDLGLRRGTHASSSEARRCGLGESETSGPSSKRSTTHLPARADSRRSLLYRTNIVLPVSQVGALARRQTNF